MSTKAADCIVVGAGPAGCSASIYLARAGVDVLLLERAAGFPRQKLCGDGLTPSSLRELDALGVVGLLGESCNPIRGGVLYSPSGASVEMAGSRPSCVVRRAQLDEALFRQVVDAGIGVRLGTNVRGVRVEGGSAIVETHAEPLRCQLVVLASGSRSSLPIYARIQRPPPADAIARRAYFSKARWPSDRLLFCYTRELLPAYGWLFPMRDGLANVGVGSFLGETSASNLAVAFKSFQSWLRGRGILGDASAPSEAGTDLLRTGMRGNSLVADRIIAVGDAAAAIDPLSGEGVSQALRSGRMAAEVARRALHRGDLSANALREYREMMRRAFGARVREAMGARLLLRSSRLIEGLVCAARERPALANQIFDMLLGDQSPLQAMGGAALALLTTGAWRRVVARGDEQGHS